MSRTARHQHEPDRATPAAAEPALAGSAGVILALQRSAGNQAVARSIQREADPYAQQQLAEKRERASEDEESWRGTVAEMTAFELSRTLGVHKGESQGKWRPVLELLSGHDDATRRAIRTAFAEYGDLEQTVKAYYMVRNNLDGLVKAWALLSAPHYHDYQVAVALALIPSETRDAELYRLLKAAAKANSQHQLRAEYDKMFAGLGRGSLQGDLEGDLEDEELMRANALMDHVLTDAERLFLNWADLEEEGETAIGIIQQVWGAGPRQFHNMKEDWDYLVTGKNGWSPYTLRQAMTKELPGYISNKDLRTGQHIYSTYEVFINGLTEETANSYLVKPKEGEEPAPLDWRQEDWILQAQILAEQRLFDQAAPEQGQDEDKSRYFASIEKIQTLSARRITLAKENGDESYAAELEKHWKINKYNLLRSIQGVFEAGSNDHVRALLLAEGNLTPADKAWMKWNDGDAAGLIALTTESWAKGEDEMLRLIGGCGSPRTTAGGILRPGVPQLANLVQGGMFGEHGERVRKLVEPGTAVSRGRNRLHYELDPAKGRSDRYVKAAFDFLTTPEMVPGLRDAVIESYVARHVPPSIFRGMANIGTVALLGVGLPPSSPVDVFLDHLAETYPSSNTVWNFYDLLAPSQDINEIVRRAEKRTLIATTGFSAGLAELFDVGGEDALATTQESLERLQYLQAQGLDTSQIQLLLGMMGKKTTNELAGVEYDMLKARVDEALAARKQAVGTFVKLVEFATQALLTVATGGASLAVAMGSSVMGIFAQEMIEGDEYDVFSEENLLKFVAPAMGSFTGKAGEALGDMAFWAKAGKLGPLLSGTAGNITDAAGEKLVDIIYDPKWPTAADVARIVITSATGAQAGLVAKRIKGNMDVVDDYVSHAEKLVKANLLSTVINQTGSLIAKIGTGAMDDKSLTEICSAFGYGLTMAQAKSLVGSLISARNDLVGYRQKVAGEEGIPTEANSPLDNPAAFKASNIDHWDRSIPMGSKTAGLILGEDGNAEIVVWTKYGRQRLRDVVVSLRPPAGASEPQKLKWSTMALQVANLERQSLNMSDGEVAVQLGSIAWTISKDFDSLEVTDGGVVGPVLDL